MGVFSKIICPKCGNEYSALRSSCPNCGARKQNESSRTPAQSDSVRRSTAANARREADSRWQLIFGLCIVAAVIIAVIVLIVTTINGSYGTYPTPTPSEAITSPTPSPSPTPTPTPTPAVESVSITFLGEVKDGFTMHGVGNTIQLDAQIYPVEITDGITWSSTDETICTVSDTGLVTSVGTGTASIVLRCYGKAAECLVIVV